MFEQLFTYPRIRARHSDGALANERLAYLTHLARNGMSSNTLRSTADHLLNVADQLGLAHRSGEIISREEILRSATVWVD
jgi:hypothetical protein